MFDLQRRQLMKYPIQAKLLRRSAVIILLPLILLTVLIPAFAHHSATTSAQAATDRSLNDSSNVGPQIPRTTLVSASQDNTLYEDATGSLSNGAGQHFFVGTTAIEAEIRRGLIAFDLSSAISGGSTVLSATLILSMSKTMAGDQAVALHPVLVEWGEGSSDAMGEEGMGTPSTSGDATWLHTFYDSSLWATAGGDFAATASATTLVGDPGSYEWNSPQMVSDVQAWIDAPANNFGWLLLGNEATAMTAKRFDSREHPTAANRPLLVITYNPPDFDFHVYLPSVTSTAASE
jgi:hypothetical protein